MPCSPPCAAVMGQSLVWRHGASARSGIRRRRKDGRASRTINPLQGAMCACSGTKNSLIQRRVKGAKHREAARPDTVHTLGNNDAQGRERPQRETFLVYPCPKLPLDFLWDELYNKYKGGEKMEEKKKNGKLVYTIWDKGRAEV